MKIRPADLYRLRWNIALFLALAGIGAGIAYGTLHLARQAALAEQQEKGHLADVKSRLDRARDEEREILAKIDNYRSLVARGVIGQEARLDWVEEINRIKAARRLFDIQYELAPQKPLDPTLLPSGATAGGFEFLASTMRLEMQLLHEDDLVGFLADLRARVKAILLVRACTVERLPPSGQQGVRPQLRAECTIDWVTLREVAKP